MKNTSTYRLHPRASTQRLLPGLSFLLPLVLGAALPSAQAASGTWNVDAAGNWTTSSNWTGGTVPGTTAGDVANFTLDITAARTVTVDGSNKNIGTLNIGDANNTHAYTLSGATSLIFNNGASDALLNQTSTSKGDTISAGISIGGNGSLTMSNLSSNTLNMGSFTQGGSAGTKVLTLDTSAGKINYTGFISKGSATTMSVVKNGTGIVTLGGTNSFNGGLTLNAGTVELNTTGALGTGTFTINGGTLNVTAGSARTMTNNNAQTWAGNFTFGTTGQDLNLGTGAVTLTGNRTLTVSTAGRTLTVGGAIAGSGFALTKAGSGILALGGASTYDGGTIVSSGTLATLSTGGDFGIGNISLTSATSKLTLGNAESIADAATLTFSSTLTAAGAINLSFTGTEILAGISRSGGAGGSIISGLYTAAELNTYFGTTIFTGTGSFHFGAIPEPSTYAAILGAVALAGTMASRRRR